MFQDIDDVSVAAPHFDNPDTKMKLSVSKSWVSQNAAHARIRPLFDFWALLKGVPPPINNIGYHEKDQPAAKLTSLLDAHAAFQGLCRPLNEDDNEDGVYVFLTCPQVMYDRVAHMVCVAKARPCPKNAVFACYVRRYEKETPDGFSGIILSWEWVKADDADPLLPQDWQGRYRNEVWRR